MKSRVFGASGQHVPIIGQGTWSLRDEQGAERALRLGLDLGLTHIDTAELYTGSEEIVGRAIAGRRDDVFLVSKVKPQNASYKGTLEACRKSLDRLGTDRLDAYLLHWWSHKNPVDETMRALGELIDQGLTRHVGVSNLDVEQVEKARHALGKKRLVCNQVYYDLSHRHVEAELLPYCQEHDIAVVAYSPFGSGTGSDPSGGNRTGRQALERVAQRHDVTLHQVTLSFLTRHEGTFAIPKAETEAHVRSNAAALDVQLDERDVEELEAAFPLPQRIKGLPMV